MNLKADDQLPIGVFDSGVGGLTVLKVLAERFPNENFLYLGDTARLPYGTKSPETIRKYSEQAIGFLARQGVKAIVIACNSASSQYRDHYFNQIPVENVIDPGALAAVNATQGTIGILGTHATVASKVYEETILQIAHKQDKHVSVFSAAAPLLVPLAEEGWVDDPITNLIVYRHIQPLLQSKIDTLILGCTHYPILQNSIARAAGINVQLITSGEALTESLKLKFQNGILHSNSNPQKNRSIRLLSTEQSKNFISMAKRLLGQNSPDELEVVSLI